MIARVPPRFATVRVLLASAAITAISCTTSSASSGADALIEAGLIGRSFYETELSDYQRALLADGKVEFAEYERAMLDLFSCLRKEALSFDGAPKLGPDEIYDYAYGVPHGSDMTSTMVEQAFDRCSSEYSATVESLWLTTFAPRAATEQ